VLCLVIVSGEGD